MLYLHMLSSFMGEAIISYMGEAMRRVGWSNKLLLGIAVVGDRDILIWDFTSIYKNILIINL